MQIAFREALYTITKVVDVLRQNLDKHQQRQLLRIVKLTSIILLMFGLVASARGLTQTLTLDVKNAPLEKVFTEIEKQSGYNFLYTAKLVKKAKKVTLQLRNATIEEALQKCFEGQPFTYKIVNKVVIINTKNEISQSPNVDATSVILPSLIDISGKVTDADGNPLSGASVRIRGTNKGTTTHNDGSFILRGVETDAVLEISYVGYQTYTVAVNNKTSIIANLKIKPDNLGEIVINKGYYSEKQKTSVSSVVKVNAADIEKQPVSNVLLALQARVPGLFIIQNSGLSGSSINVRVQGENSIKNGNDPLYVVDGVPVDAQLPTTGVDYGSLFSYAPGGRSGFGNPLNYLNPLDIESIEVLKDADATSLYGSRAANGAILITTKKGKAGDMRLNLNLQSGWGKMTRRMDMMNTRQYLDMRYEAFANDRIDWRSPSVSANDLKLWDTTRYTNWQDELLGGTSHYNDYNASVSGGSTNMRYLVSGTYHKETTIFPLPKDFADQKAAVHFNLNATNSNQKLRMQFSGNYLFDDNQLPQFDLTQTALLLEPDAPPLLNADGSINWAPDVNGNSSLSTVTVTAANPLTQRYLKYENKTYNLISNLKLDYIILPGLNIGSSFGYNYMQTNDFSPFPLIAVAPEERARTQRSASFGERNIQSWIIEPQASYHTQIKKGILDVFVGSTFQDKKAIANSVLGTGQLSDELLENIKAAAVISQGGNASKSEYRYNALFSRASYNWSDKYILSLNARRDGSTRFGGANRFHNFGSAGAAWIFSGENFFKPFSKFVSFGKLRGNYGTTGNDQIGDYQFMSLYELVSAVPYQGIVGLQPAGLPNQNLEWEETRKLQIGIDLNFFGDRIITSTNYVRNHSSNQLLTYRLPSPAGYDSYLTNFPATVENRNWEFLVTGKIIEKKDFTWTATINLTLPQNKLIEFPGLDTSAYANFLVIGQPIGVTKTYAWMGIAPGTGDNLYADRDGHLTLTPGPDDNPTLITRSPKFYGGFNNTITYKNLQLDFIFQLVKQNGFNDAAFWNNHSYPGMFAAGTSNQPVTVLDRWQKPGDMNKTVARYSTFEVPYIIASDHRFTDASYISLKNVSLSWSLPQEWMSKAQIKSFRVYLHAQNLLTLSHYKGLNPETQSMRSLPPLQVWTVGLQLGL